MPTLKTKIRHGEEDVRSQKSHYTNVSKAETSPSKNVELCLEVEMDDEVRDIIKSPEKCHSALLDVTVIKPKGLDKYTTEKQTLKTEEVRQLIESMNLSNDGKKELIEKLFGRNSVHKTPDKKGQKRKSCLAHKCKNLKRSLIKLEQGDVLSATDETNSVVYSLLNQKALPKYSVKPQQQIYTTPKTYDNIRKMFACTNEDKDINTDKPDQPCLCQNCAIVGILTDSQKKPFATEPIPEPVTSQEIKYRKPSRKKSVAFKHANDFPSTSTDHQQCHAAIDVLSARISHLEKRIAMQEERAVPKDYFKKIITKLVNHLTKLTHYTTEDKNTVYNQRRKDSSSYGQYKPPEKHHRFFANPAFVSNTYKIPAEKELEPKECTSTDPPKSPSEGLWKWGGEVLTSGRDFKNKVVMLLEETLQNLKKGWEKAEERNRNDDLQSLVEKLNLVKTVENKDLESRAGVKVKCKKENGINKQFISRIPQRKGPSVNVAYVNPQVTQWPEDSSASFRVESTDGEVRKEKMTEQLKKTHKIHFLKILQNTNTSDRYRLWQSIYNRAIDNHQNKKDTVTVQIPDPKDRRKMIPIDFTIEDLEKLLTSVKEPNR